MNAQIQLAEVVDAITVVIHVLGATHAIAVTATAAVAAAAVGVAAGKNLS